MTSASYAVVRYVADPARNEPLNIGVVLWTDFGARLQLDSEAIFRVIRENPHLTNDSLLYLDQYLRRRLALDQQLNGVGGIEERVRRGAQIPVLLSEPLTTTIFDVSDASLDREMMSLLARIVQPPKRRGGGPRPGAVNELARRWKPWLGHRLVRNHVFDDTKTGNPRTVHFFANSGANVAVDVLRLAVQDGQAIQQRADAEAFKVEDVLTGRDIQFVVHCELRSDDKYRQVNDAALRSIVAAGATVMTDVEKTVEEVESALGVW